jgi:hypothetical protein
METDSIVVMEDGASWPAWVDHEAGQVSNVVILARQPGESLSAFGARAELRLQGQVALASPRRGVLVAGPARGADARSCRSHVMRALAGVVRRAGGGEIVLVGDDDAGLVAELRSFVERINQRDGGGRVSLRIRRPPTERAQRVA